MSVRAEPRSRPATVSVGQARDERVSLGAAHAEQHDDRVGREPSRGEDERARRRRVGEVQVVDDDGDRPVLGVPADQAQHRRADREPVAPVGAADGAGSASAADERVRLHRGDAVERAQRGPQQLQQRGERDLALGLEPGRAQHAACRPAPLDGVVEQGGLADAGLAASASTPLVPRRAAATSRSIACCSACRPTSMAPSLGARSELGASPTDRERASASVAHPYASEAVRAED